MSLKPFFLSLLIFSIVPASIVFSQDTTKINPLKRQLMADSTHIFRFKKYRPQVAIDNRNSFIKDGPINVKGFSGGVLINEKYSIGLGLYNMQKNSKSIRSIDKEKNITTYRSVKLGYLSAYFNYTFLDTRYWEIGVPVEVGIGNYTVTTWDSSNTKIIAPPKTGGIIPLQAGLDVSFKPIKYLGINLLSGYRYVIDGNSKLNFNGAFYSLGLQIYMREIIQNTRYYYKKKKFKRAVRKLNTAS